MYVITFRHCADSETYLSLRFTAPGSQAMICIDAYGVQGRTPEARDYLRAHKITLLCIHRPVVNGYESRPSVFGHSLTDGHTIRSPNQGAGVRNTIQNDGHLRQQEPAPMQVANMGRESPDPERSQLHRKPIAPRCAIV